MRKTRSEGEEKEPKDQIDYREELTKLAREQEEMIQESLELFDFSRPLPIKEDGIWRIYYNNCNGIEINHTLGEYIKQKQEKKQFQYIKEMEGTTKLDGILRQLKNWKVDIAGMAEMCTAWEDLAPRRVVQSVTKKYDTKACWTVASSKLRVGSYCKPGGTGILTMGDGNGRIQHRGTDPWNMGRWSYVHFKGSAHNNSLLIITAYRVGKRSDVPGPKTAWAQQRTMLVKEGRTEAPHEAFYEDITKWLATYKETDTEILLCLDANEKWTKVAGIKKLSQDLQLINVNKEFNLCPTHTNITNTRNSTSIDFCLCSTNLLRYITYATSTPYDMELLDDHRGVIIDINVHRLMNETTQKQERKQRKLHMSNPEAVKKYLEEVKLNFTHQNIFQRCQRLMRDVNQGTLSTTVMMRRYNQIDKEVLGICQKAEKQCRRDWAGQYEWSPALATAIQRINYWRHRLKHEGETEVSTKMEKDLNLEYTPMTKQCLYQKLDKSRKELREIRKKARENRQEHLEKLAEQYAMQHNLSHQQAIIEILAHEDSRETYRLLRNQIKYEDRKQLMSLWEARDEEGNYVKDEDRKIIHTKSETIHKALLQRNERHLNQAAGTPFAQGRLRKKLKWDGTGRLSDEILTGEILNRRRFDAEMQLYLESIRVNRLSNLGVVKPTLLLEDYQTFWKKKHETTATSPYRLHVGHYKAATMNLAILNVHRVLLLIPFQTGQVPYRWRKTVQTMIEKDNGAPWIHRLRIIELFDSQANAGFQIFVGRKLMHHAVNNSLLSEESYGSTPKKMATSALLQKILTIDQLRIEQRAGGIFDCDASGCYDRILPPLASVHLQALGLSQSIGAFLARIMYKAKRHVQTDHGISQQNMSTTRKKTLYGIGQGNGGGPAMWISHLTVMFKAISSVCIGFAITCVQAVEQVTTVGTGYVDDVTLGLSIPKEEDQTERAVYKHMKQMSQLWKALLYITGGRLELSKCFWIPITWRWVAGKPIMVNKTHRSKELYLKESESGEIIQIPRKPGKEAVKRLGVISSCDGKWTTEYNNWIQFSMDFGKRVIHNRKTCRPPGIPIPVGGKI